MKEFTREEAMKKFMEEIAVGSSTYFEVELQSLENGCWDAEYRDELYLLENGKWSKQ